MIVIEVEVLEPEVKVFQGVVVLLRTNMFVEGIGRSPVDLVVDRVGILGDTRHAGPVDVESVAVPSRVFHALVGIGGVVHVALSADFAFA